MAQRFMGRILPRAASVAIASATLAASLTGASVPSTPKPVPGHSDAPPTVGHGVVLAPPNEAAPHGLVVRANHGDHARRTAALLDSSQVPQKVAYLTFDDGPDPANTKAVLDRLATYGASATFFVVGENALKYPDLVDEEVADGDIVGNHTWNHAKLVGLDQARFDAQVLTTKRLLGSRGSDLLRPPYGAFDPLTAAYAQADGYRVQLWDVDTQDWDRPGVSKIVQNVLTTIHPGAVILMHDGGGDRSQTVAALDQILRTLTGQGWRFLALGSGSTNISTVRVSSSSGNKSPT
jgi:peptidoglycan/xylan/chitin deacetylase (PgdA/CDA1 family)